MQQQRRFTKTGQMTLLKATLVKIHLKNYSFKTVCLSFDTQTVHLVLLKLSIKAHSEKSFKTVYNLLLIVTSQYPNTRNTLIYSSKSSSSSKNTKSIIPTEQSQNKNKLNTKSSTNIKKIKSWRERERGGEGAVQTSIMSCKRMILG